MIKIGTDNLKYFYFINYNFTFDFKRELIKIELKQHAKVLTFFSF